MWFIWIMWVIVAIAIIATIILLTGKGSMLVSGFNTKSPEERAKYDKEKVSKQTGLLMIFVDVGLLALTSYIQFRAIPAIQNITISDYGTAISLKTQNNNDDKLKFCVLRGLLHHNYTIL